MSLLTQIDAVKKIDVGNAFVRSSVMTNSVGSFPRIVWVQLAGSARRYSLLLVLTAEHWLERRRQRQALRAASDHLLKDIGISRAEAAHEAFKPFWRD